VFHGGTPQKKTAEYWIGDIPWVSPKDMKTDRLSDTADHISKKALDNSATRLMPTDSIFAVARSGVLAHSFPVALIDKPMAFNQDIKALVPNRELVLPEYLFYFLRYREHEIVSRGVKKGATVHSLQSAYLENLEVPLPQLQDQQVIVDILKRADGIRHLRNQAQDTIRQLIPALFVDMFGDPATNSKGWLVTAVGEVIESADYGSSMKASEDGSGMPLIRMGNVDYSGRLDLTELKYVQLPDDQIAKYRLSEGDLLFNRTNSKDLVGKTSLWFGSTEAVAASYFIRVRVNRSVLNPFYLWAFMNSGHMKRVLFDTARGAIGQSNINAKELRAFRLPLPPVNLQEGFEQSCRNVLALEVQGNAAASKNESVFQALLHSAFTSNR
jgi:type I restriction enzyme S subunit